MKLSTKGRYAVMALVDMTEQQVETPISLTGISQRQALPLPYLEQIFVKLRSHKIVDSVRGSQGGFRFNRHPSRITIQEILDALEESLQATRCAPEPTEGCVHGRRCNAHDLWDMLTNQVSRYLGSITLQDVKDKKFSSQRDLWDFPILSKQKPPVVYLDYNATSPLRPESLKTLIQTSQLVGNGSSVHTLGRQVRSLLEEAREVIATELKIKPAQVIFTSGGTESNITALRSLLKNFPHSPLFLSPIEHDSIRWIGKEEESLGNHRIHWLKVTSQGLIDQEDLQAQLDKTSFPPLVSIMLANNETGVIQPIAEIASIVHRKGGLIHSDGAQAIGRTPVSFPDLGVDLLTLSSHKLGGPKGAGALIIQENLPFTPLLGGGGQEKNRRSGTENLPALAGFTVAFQEALKDDKVQLQQMQWTLETILQREFPEITVFSQGAPRLPNTTCLSMPGIKNETQLMAFDLAGFAVSAGSACSSGKVGASHVLKAMGVPEEEAETAIRVSWGWQTTLQDMEAFITCWANFYKKQKLQHLCVG